MIFDFEWFTRSVEKVYPDDNRGLYSLEDTLAVFHYYFDAYEQCMRVPHPPLKAEQIERIIYAMPTIPDEYCQDAFLPEPESYELMIDRYFETDFGKCDYRINHFFSGQIRKIKFYETCY